MAKRIIIAEAHADGKPVYNELTRMFLDAHFDCDCVYPKLHVRVCGFSARFISLSKRWQDEVIARHRLK